MPYRAIRRIYKQSRQNQGRDEDFGGITRSVGNAIIGLLVTLIGTGIVAMITLYVNVSTLAVTVKQTSENMAAHLRDSVSEKQYQRDNTQIWAEMQKMVTQPQMDGIKQTLTDHGLVLRKIEDKLEQLPVKK